MISKAPRRSATRRASGPLTCVSCMPIVAISGAPTVLACGMRPNVGFNALTPQHCAGWRSDPSPSFPRPNGLMPVAMAAASPALEAPGVRERFQGFTVAPKARSRNASEWRRWEGSCDRSGCPRSLQALNDGSISTWDMRWPVP